MLLPSRFLLYCFCCFHLTATPVTYTLSLHDALPIYRADGTASGVVPLRTKIVTLASCKPSALAVRRSRQRDDLRAQGHRSEEHTSELQSRQYLVCRLLLEKKKKQHNRNK